jgi:hypothetical protein
VGGQGQGSTSVDVSSVGVVSVVLKLTRPGVATSAPVTPATFSIGTVSRLA